MGVALGIVENDDKAIRTMGGMEGIGKVREGRVK